MEYEFNIPFYLTLFWVGYFYPPILGGGGAKLPPLSRIQENGPIAAKLLSVGRTTLKLYVLTKKVDVTSSTLLTSAFLLDPSAFLPSKTYFWLKRV